MSIQVKIHGGGIAACACASLLQKQRFQTAITTTVRTNGPTLLLNASTQRLLQDVFELREDFFAPMHPIRRRIVLWGNGAAVELAHTGVVTSEAALLERLWSGLEMPDASFVGKPDFEIYSTAGMPERVEQHFGVRRAQAVPVEIRVSASDACWIESLANGWLFLIPSGPGSGSLLAVGGPSQDLLAKSRLIASEVTRTQGSSTSFPAYPRITEALHGTNWLACGGSAMSFDPICGEGVGNALREAILGCAVIRAGPYEPALEEYSARLLLGFLKHLENARGFYASANRSSWWSDELESLERGIRWTRNRLAGFGKAGYRLAGFQLEKVS